MQSKNQIKDSSISGFNWKRGAFRLWVLIAVIWIGSTAWIETRPSAPNSTDIFSDIPSPRSRQGCEDAAKAEPRVNVEACVALAPEQNWRDAQKFALALLPPLGVLIFGLAFCWVISGFRPRQIKK